MKTENAMMFDLDGTLTNTLPLSIEGSAEAIKAVTGKELTVEDITFLFGKTEDAMFKHYAPENWQKAKDFYRDWFRQHAGPEIVFDGIFDVLNYLKDNGIKTALVTGRGPVTTEIILQRTGLYKYFEFVKTGSEFGSIKTQCMQEILQYWNQDPAKSYYIGDVPHDVVDAKAAGVNSLSCAWFSKADKALLEKEGPLKIFESVKEFETWLKAI
ncbi:phosphoglycolate phosphatase-like HAD superfamily hydrolase [Elusimicrobium posterum]|uniref:HAD family hydrolase n=1 Tax=Elusimicrobium posterum TaxID=3116653 RepID=UPI003C751DCB